MKKYWKRVFLRDVPLWLSKTSNYNSPDQITIPLNLSTDASSEARRREVNLYQQLGHRDWSWLKGYGRRWMVETAYYTFKGAFGDYSMARTLQNITNELVAKAAIYNLLTNP